MGLRIIKKSLVKSIELSAEAQLLRKIHDDLVKATARRFFHTTDDSGTAAFLEKLEEAKRTLPSEFEATALAELTAERFHGLTSAEFACKPGEHPLTQFGVKKNAMNQNMVLFLLG